LGDGRIVTTTQVTTPLLPVLTPVNATNQTYGKVAGGVAGQLAGNVSGMINAYTTFGRNDGNFYGVNGGIKVQVGGTLSLRDRDRICAGSHSGFVLRVGRHPDRRPERSVRALLLISGDWFGYCRP